ncbi:response regulator [Oligoflexia bacterium]|nr:response regulator [Oligoflexia bacterium]
MKESKSAVLTEAACILVVEDNALIRLCTVKFLQSVGFTVEQACDGKEALEILKKHGQSISLVITDLMMPHMNGDELCKEIRKSYEGLPVILVSGSSITEYFQNPTSHGFFAALRKPVSSANLFNSATLALGTSHVEGLAA